MTVRASAPVRLARLVLAASLALPAGVAVSAERTAAERGGDLYRIYCRACHGDAGRGNGPTGGELQTTPTDLTRLAATNDGEFPTDRVYRAIDGRDEIAPHRRREMPRWGFAFQEFNTDVHQEDRVRERIDCLIQYLKSIQAERD